MHNIILQLFLLSLCMRYISTFMPIILLCIICVLMWFGYNNIIEKHSIQAKAYSDTRTLIIEMNASIQKEQKLLDSLILANKRLDTLLHKYNAKLKYIQGQNEEIYRTYNNINIVLPDL